MVTKSKLQDYGCRNYIYIGIKATGIITGTVKNMLTENVVTVINITGILSTGILSTGILSNRNSV